MGERTVRSLRAGSETMADWGEVFHFSVPVGETFLRGTVMFLALFAIARMAGKREAGSRPVLPRR